MKNILLFFGGDSCEHDISIITAYTVYNQIKHKYRIYPIYLKNNKLNLLKKDLKIENIVSNKKSNYYECWLKNGKLIYKTPFTRIIKIDCSVNCCHGGCGENGALSGLLDIFNIPYTSAGIYSSALFMDKYFTKIYLHSINAPILPYCYLSKGEELHNKFLPEFPLIVKPARQGSSIGIGVAKNYNELIERVNFAEQFDDKILIEKALVDFRELNCAIYKKAGEVIISDIECIYPNKNFYDFNSKYVDDNIKREFPAQISDTLVEQVRSLAVEIYNSLDVKGVIRIDFLLDVKGELYVNEVNTIPGSLAFNLFTNNGIKLIDIVSAMIDEALDEKERKKNIITSYQANILESLNSCKLKNGINK